MANFCGTSILLAALKEIATHVSRICVVSTNFTTAVTATQAETTAGYCIANTTISESGGGLTIGDSSVTGKKIDVAAQNGLTVGKTGVAGGVALISTGATGLVYWYATCAEQTISSTANTINIGAYIIRVSDAT